MKIAADYFEEGLGISLSFLVGALVLGTALPHLLKGVSINLFWKTVFVFTSSLSVLGGTILLLFVPDGPFRKPSQCLNFSAFYKVFKKPVFRSATFGYFGHMWELYAFWAFAPVMLKIYTQTHDMHTLNISLWSFIIIACGGLGCVLGGYLSKKLGVKKIAFICLFLSCSCCMISPMLFKVESSILFLAFLIFWGMVVIADSPLFSTLVARNASSEIKGTALTIVNCIGFAITIVSIQLMTVLRNLTDSNSIFAILALGPILGLIALNVKNKPNSI